MEIAKHVYDLKEVTDMCDALLNEELAEEMWSDYDEKTKTWTLKKNIAEFKEKKWDGKNMQLITQSYGTVDGLIIIIKVTMVCWIGKSKTHTYSRENETKHFKISAYSRFRFFS